MKKQPGTQKVNILQCLQLMLCCYIFPLSLSMSVCCHEKNEIQGRDTPFILIKYRQSRMIAQKLNNRSTFVR